MYSIYGIYVKYVKYLLNHVVFYFCVHICLNEANVRDSLLQMHRLLLGSNLVREKYREVGVVYFHEY